MYILNTVLACDVPQHPYLGQNYVFLTKHDHCVYFLMIGTCRSQNMWNIFRIGIYYKRSSWSKLSVYCQLCGRCNIKSCYLIIYLFVSVPKLDILDMGIFPDLTFCSNATVVCKVKPCTASVQWTFSGKNITEEMRCVFY